MLHTTVWGQVNNDWCPIFAWKQLKFIIQIYNKSVNCINWLLFCILLLPRVNGNGQRHTDSEAGGVCECVGGPWGECVEFNMGEWNIISTCRLLHIYSAYTRQTHTHIHTLTRQSRLRCHLAHPSIKNSLTRCQLEEKNEGDKSKGSQRAENMKQREKETDNKARGSDGNYTWQDRNVFV